MLEQQSFLLVQLAYIKAAATQLPKYRPDALTPLQIGGLRTAGNAIKEDYRDKKFDLDIARGGLAATHGPGHAACVAVYPCLKSCYRNDPKHLRAIVALPKNDRAPDKTLERMKGISKLWSKLPNPPGASGPFKVGDLDGAAFDLLKGALDAAHEAFVDADQAFQAAEGALQASETDLQRFVSAALIQGRAQFPEGTAGRSVIDAVPTEPPTQLPDQAVIGVAESPAEGAVHLQFEGEHATSFQVWHKGPGEPQFTKVAEVLKPGDYAASGLAGGTHEYKIVPENSRGEGPASAVASIPVAAAQVA